MNQTAGRSLMEKAGNPDQPAADRDLRRRPQPEPARGTEIPRARHGASETEHADSVWAAYDRIGSSVPPRLGSRPDR
jgi:hypothetical protein